MNNLIIQGYGITDKGLIRPTNEDYFFVQDNLFIIADGMGGQNAGEIASKLTVETISININNFFQSNIASIESLKDYKNIIDRVIKTANQQVIQKATQEPLHKGMGTTIVLALFQKPDIMHIANVGDSRAYLFRKNQLNVISEDHSLAKIMIDNYSLNYEEVKRSHYQNYLTRAIGIQSNIEPYYTTIPLISKDKILLCSDGLWNMVDEKEIITILQKNTSDLLKCKKLINRANELGGVDNITIIIISATTQ